MKKVLPAIVLSAYLVALSFISYSQSGGVSINNSNTPAHPSAMLDVSSTSSPYMGMLIPRMTTANRNTISSPATGLQIFNTDCGVNEYYTGTCWITMNQVLAAPLHITCSGTTDFCANETRALTIPPVTGATNYDWVVPAGATITSGQGTTSVTVVFGNNSGQVCVRAYNLCEMSQSICLDIHINPVPLAPGNITGPQNIVPGATTASYFIAAVPTANLYNWTLPSGATITAGIGTTNINVSFSCSAVSGYVSVTAQNNCGVSYTSSLSITASPVIANAGANIVSPGTLGGSPTATAGTSPYTYSWLPSTALNSNAVANPISTACATTTYTVIVTDFKGCTSSSSTTALDNNHVIANAGTNNVTPGTLGGSPTATSGTPPYSYSWVPSTALNSNAASNPTTTVCSTTAYTVTVTDVYGCSASSSTTASMVNPVSANAGPDIVSPGTLGGSPTASGGTLPYIYAWAPSTNLSSTMVANPTTTICTMTTYTVTVADANGCSSSSSATATIDPVPATPGSITGNTSPSCNSTEAYSISPVTYATTYTWTVPVGNIIASGQGTTSITVNFSGASGDITVTAGNCGTSSASTLGLTLTGGAGSGSQTFSYTGNQQTFIVPCGVTSVTIQAYGAQGGHGYGGGGGYTGQTGGLGGLAYGNLTVSPNQVLYVYVGGAGANGVPNTQSPGGFNGGGNGASNSVNGNASSYEGGGGGGASDVRVGGTGLGDRVIVGGGGGGGGSYNNASGGCGGYPLGCNAYDNSGAGAGGTGGTQSAGGTGTGGSGSLGTGGEGTYCGGGGGGGYYGGGSSGGSCNSTGAGGGSSYYGGMTSGTGSTNNTQSGNGQVIINWQ